jgi:hypothetical protein
MTISSCVPSSLLALGFAGIYYQKDKKKKKMKRKEKKRKACNFASLARI